MSIDPLPIEPMGPVDATVALPGSKSITNRALVCAALADGTTVLDGALASDDTEAMEACIVALGGEVEVDGAIRSIVPMAMAGAPARVDARQSGTTARFLLPVLALGGEPVVLDGDVQLRERPMGPSIEAVRALGATVQEQAQPGHLPVLVSGPVTGGRVELTGDVSSQFLSGLLLAGPAMADGLHVRLSTPLVSRPYVDMTVSVMRAFGADVVEDADGSGWRIAGTGYRATRYVIEPDASAASYAWGAAVVTGGTVTVTGLSRHALQGDVAFADLLGRMGADVTWGEDSVTVTGTGELHGIDVAMADISDTVPTLAVVAALADSPTTIREVGFIRGKETDRIAAVVTELRRCGIEARETEDGVLILPAKGSVSDQVVVQTYRDHRMAMAFALLGLRRTGVSIADPGCVAKTFPGYWDLLDGLRRGAFPPAETV